MSDPRPTLWRKRPVEVAAMRWDPSDPAATGALIGWLDASAVDFRATHGVGASTALSIHTLEGNMIVSPGDWVIRGLQGEFYPCKPDIFEATYVAIEGAPAEPATTWPSAGRVPRVPARHNPRGEADGASAPGLALRRRTDRR